MLPDDHARPAAEHPVRMVFPLYFAFLFTGIATVLLGVVLPRIAVQHQLSDSQSGILLTTQFAASACGALFVRRHFARTLLRGYLLMAAGAACLALAPAPEAIAAIAIFALGLGMAMTSSSLLVGQIFCDSRGSAMSILNFCWSIGATLCPIILARLPGRFSLVDLCFSLAVLSAAFCLLLLPTLSISTSAASVPATVVNPSSWMPILLFAALGFLYVGAEATLGGWMTTYAARILRWNVGGSSVSAACFWGAILVGRGVTPLFLRFLSEQRLHRLAIVGSLVGILILLDAHRPFTLLAGACCAGLMMGPIFPLTVSLFIGRVGKSANMGWVFALAGFGGAAFPWAAGVLSSTAHSLRVGLLVTLIAAAGMLFLTLQISPFRRRQLAASPVQV